MIPGVIMRTVVVLVLLALAVAACGTKGALYLPPEEGETSSGAKKK